MKELHFFNTHELNSIIDVTQNLKHRCIILLMADCGLRVSEVINLKIESFDFKNRFLICQSLKKRDENEFRKIPLSQRLFRELAEYIYTLNNVTPGDWLFPCPNDKNLHIQRFAVNRFLRRLKQKHHFNNKLHPHTFRHTFATNLVKNKVPLENIKLMLGHKSYDTTLIYAHVPFDTLRDNIESVAKKQTNFLKRFFLNYWTTTKSINIRRSDASMVGRSAELDTINNFLQKDINICLLGEPGTGKTMVLNNIVTSKKVLILDDTSNIKKSLVYLLIYLYDNDKEAVKNLIFGDFDTAQISAKLNRESVRNLCEEIIKLVDKKKYILKIHDIDEITPRVTKVLNLLKDHFQIITSARNIALNKSDFLWNFEKIEINNLSRSDSFELIQKLSFDFEIEDFEMYRNHIYEQTDGNPRAICDMIERYKHEPFILRENIRDITHFGALKEWDMSFFVVLFIASIAILRYMTTELHNPSLRFIGGVAMILLIFSRSIFSKTRRKWL